jgi:hypothetical protein
MEAAPFGLHRILPHPHERLEKLENEGPQVGLWEDCGAELMYLCCSQTKQNGRELWMGKSTYGSKWNEVVDGHAKEGVS